MPHEFPEYRINPNKITGAGESVTLTADKQVLLKIKDQLGVDQISSFEAQLRVSTWGSNGISVTGDIKASILQTCVVTLDPLPTKINTSFVRYFLPEENARDLQPDIVDGEIILDPMEEDYPDVIEGNSLNLWDVVLEVLNLEIDPHPRSRHLEQRENSNAESESGEPETHRPFSELDKLISAKKSGN